MKKILKVIMLSICILFLPLSALYAESIKDNTYLVLIRTPVRFWTDQFEFDTGDVFRAYTTRQGEKEGKWVETELFEGSSISLTWFQAFVEKSEETTTTTSIPDEIPTPSSESLLTPQQIKFDINIWGLASTYTITSPDPTPTDPLNTKTLGFSLMIGYGAYLGADVTFLGVAGVEGGGGGGGTPEWGSISPEEGMQEENLSVEIGGKNTTFQDDGPVDIAFIPNDNNDLTISGINTVDNETIEFNLAIAANAATEFKSVTVTYDNGSKFVIGTNVFEVKAK